MSLSPLVYVMSTSCVREVRSVCSDAFRISWLHRHARRLAAARALCCMFESIGLDVAFARLLTKKDVTLVFECVSDYVFSSPSARHPMRPRDPLRPWKLCRVIEVRRSDVLRALL